MGNWAKSNAILLLFVIAGSGCVSARAFISSKTNLQLSGDVMVCSQGVDDPDSCKPGRTGGAPWRHNYNFDTYSISPESAQKGHEAALDELRLRYLGTPYYNGAIHIECRNGLTIADLPSDDRPIADIIDLTSLLQSKAVDSVAANAILKLRAKGVALDAAAQNAFKATLAKSVNEKANVRYIWFLMKWTGGRDSIRTSPKFKACVDEVEQKKNTPGSSSFVTGVAGLLVLSNNVDTTVASESTITNALNASIAGTYPANIGEIQAEVGSEWRRSVNSVFTVDGSLKSLSQTVYPLWMQFE